jgi:Mrp family chromosome partitioning ATPase
MLSCQRFAVVLTCKVERNREGEDFMRAITLASQKGGTGKSILCIGLAVAAIEDGERVSSCWRPIARARSQTGLPAELTPNH